MMALLPPVGWGDVATRRDLELLEARIEGRLSVVEHRLDSMATMMATKQDLAEFRAQFRMEVADSHNRLLRTIVPWLFASQATVAAVVGVLFAVLR